MDFLFVKLSAKHQIDNRNLRELDEYVLTISAAITISIHNFNSDDYFLTSGEILKFFN